MKGVQIGNGAFLDFSNTDFICPYCGKMYSDSDEKYLKRVNKNKFGITRIRCTYCENWFGMTYDFKADAKSFKLEK